MCVTSRCTVVTRRSDNKLGYMLHEDVGVEGKGFRFLDMEHGQNVMCAGEGMTFLFDSSSGKHHTARLVDLEANKVIADVPISAKTTCMALESTSPSRHPGNRDVRVWHCDTDRKIYCWESADKARSWKLGKEQGVAIEPCPTHPGVLVLTQNTVVFATATGGVLFHGELPHAPPPEVQFQVEGQEHGFSFPSLDHEDVTWQVRPFRDYMVVLTQNRVLLSNKVGAWHILENMPGMMDAKINRDNTQLYLTHINGDLFRLSLPIDPHTKPDIFTPKECVVGRKADACSHMLAVTPSGIIIGRPEGMIDTLPLEKQYTTLEINV